MKTYLTQIRWLGCQNNAKFSISCEQKKSDKNDTESQFFHSTQRRKLIYHGHMIYLDLKLTHWTEKRMTLILEGTACPQKLDAIVVKIILRIPIIPVSSKTRF